jgi:hypothetical protein
MFMSEQCEPWLVAELDGTICMEQAAGVGVV